MHICALHMELDNNDLCEYCKTHCSHRSLSLSPSICVCPIALGNKATLEPAFYYQQAR